MMKNPNPFDRIKVWLATNFNAVNAITILCFLIAFVLVTKATEGKVILIPIPFPMKF